MPGKLFPTSSGSWSDFITWTTLKMHDWLVDGLFLAGHLSERRWYLQEKSTNHVDHYCFYIPLCLRGLRNRVAATGALCSLMVCYSRTCTCQMCFMSPRQQFLLLKLFLCYILYWCYQSVSDCQLGGARYVIYLITSQHISACNNNSLISSIAHGNLSDCFLLCT